jgi:hypothetical protein
VFVCFSLFFSQVLDRDPLDFLRWLWVSKKVWIWPWIQLYQSYYSRIRNLISCRYVWCVWRSPILIFNFFIDPHPLLDSDPGLLCMKAWKVTSS